MVEDMENIFGAIKCDDQYMHDQYKETWNSLKSGEFREPHIWKKFTIFIDWMEKSLPKEQFCDVLGKKYDLDDGILCRIQKPEGVKALKTYETWLMSSLFRYVVNPANDPVQKYVGKIKLTKMVKRIDKVTKVSYEGEYDIWTPSMKRDNGEDAEVDDIRIEVYNDDGTPRRYELEYGWNDKWSKEEAPWENDKKFLEFERQWGELKSKMIIPGWYRFDPRDPENPGTGHNLMKEWDSPMFDSLKCQKWYDTVADKNHSVEKSHFFMDCSNLLGIGGEGIIIRKSVTKKIKPPVKVDQENAFEALKIIPIMDAKENVKTVYQKNKADTLRHDSIIDYLNIYLDVMRIFGQKVFVIVIGKHYRQSEILNKCTRYLKNFHWNFRWIFFYIFNSHLHTILL